MIRSTANVLLVAVLLSGGSAVQVASGQDAKGATSVDRAEATAVASKREAMCSDGNADGYPCWNVHLLSFLPKSQLGAVSGIGLNDAWGWVDPETGQRWALVGREDGTAFVEITDPASPRYAGQLPMPQTAQSNVWRDIKVDGTYAFIVADGSSSRRGLHGMQVFDLRHLRTATAAPVTFEADALYAGFNVAHNIVVNEETNRAYAVGARLDQQSCNAGLHIIDISNPLAPEFLGCFSHAGTGRVGGGYTHDAQCVVYSGPDTTYQGREICVGANETAISVAEVTNPDSPRAISRANYPAASYVHQGWFTEDQRYFVQNDELDERVFDNHTHTYIWDMTDLDDPVLLTDFASDAVSTDHNLYVRGELVYQANYSSGLRILDISDPAAPFVTGFFDTRPFDDAVNFNGAWTAWPYPDSDLVIISSRSEGLFVVRPGDLLGVRFEDIQLAASGSSVDLSWQLNQPADLARLDIISVARDGSRSLVQSLVNPDAEGSVTVETGEGVFTLMAIGHGADGGQIESRAKVINVVSGTHLFDAVWPNPAANSARTIVAVRQGQHVRATVYDAAGKEVARLYDSLLSADRSLDLEADVSSLPAGPYFLRVTGETFQETRPFVVAR